MNKKISLGIAIAFMAIVAAITFCITMIYSQNSYNEKIKNVQEREQIYKKISEIDKYVRENFKGEVDEQALLDSIAKGYILGLDDDYGNYFNQEEYKKLKLSNEGNMVGIGITARQDESGYIQVIKVYDDSPAKNSGIVSGDLIKKVNDIEVNKSNYNETIDSIRGEAGTKVNLVISRAGEELKFEVTRKSIVIPSVSHKMIGYNGYIKISEFNSATVGQFMSAKDELLQKGATGFIFDVRNDGGGTLDSVSEILDSLLPAGDIVSATYANGETKVLKTSDKNELDMPMVVLMNSNSASAAELFSAALKDYDKAKLVGNNSFGKGVMQTTIPLKDGSAIHITTALFNPPSGKNFNKVGLKPDYEVSLKPDQEKNLDSLGEQDDSQLVKAIEVLNSEKNK